MSHSYCPDCGSTAAADIAGHLLTVCCGAEPIGSRFASREKSREDHSSDGNESPFYGLIDFVNPS